MAVILHDITGQVPDDLELALVIAGRPITGTADQRHAGFMVKGHDGTLWLFDLAWHNAYRRSVITDEYVYLVAQFLDPYSATAIVGFLATLYDANQGRLPYGINYENGEYFDDAGNRLKTGLGQGLTCATFVLEALRRYGFDLVDRSTWPVDANAQWQGAILMKLIETRPTSVDDFLAQFQHVGAAARFRPEEAVGAAHYYEDMPLAYEAVSMAAGETVAEMQRLGKD